MIFLVLVCVYLGTLDNHSCSCFEDKGLVNTCGDCEEKMFIMKENHLDKEGSSKFSTVSRRKKIIL